MLFHTAVLSHCRYANGCTIFGKGVREIRDLGEKWNTICLHNKYPACSSTVSVSVSFLHLDNCAIWWKDKKKSQEDYSTCNAIPYFYCFFCSLFPFFPLYARLKGVTSLDDRGLHFLDPSYSWFIFPYFPQHVPLSCSLVRIFYTV